MTVVLNFGGGWCGTRGNTCKSVYVCIYLRQCVYSMYIYTQCTQPQFLVLLSDCTALLTVLCFIDTAEIQL